MVIVRSGVGVNYREPPDKIGRVGISVLHLQKACDTLDISIYGYK